MNCGNFKLKRVILLVVQPSTYSTLGVYESPPLASVVCYLVKFALQFNCEMQKIVPYSHC